jgi:hypothetical protein
VLSSVNIVDDADHVCRAATSLHLTEQLLGHRTFIATSLSEILLGDGKRPRGNDTLTVFSPFGLGSTWPSPTLSGETPTGWASAPTSPTSCRRASGRRTADVEIGGDSRLFDAGAPYTFEVCRATRFCEPVPRPMPSMRCPSG